MGAVPEPLFRDELVQLLYDRDWRVVSEAIGSIRRRVLRDGGSPLYLPTLVSLLRDRRLKHSAREALAAFGGEVQPALVHFLNDQEEHMWVRRALPNTIASLDSAEAPGMLLSNLARQQEPFLRAKIIEALCSVREDISVAAPEGLVGEQIHVEVRRYFKRLADLLPLERGNGEPARLLRQLLEERAQRHLWNIFGLLSLVFPPEHIWAAHRSLGPNRKDSRAHALEYLDNTLEGDVRRDVMAVLDERSVEQKLDDVGLRLGVRRVSRSQVLGRLLTEEAEQESDECFLTVAALLAVHNAGERERLPLVEQLAGSKDAFVAETAAWVQGSFTDREMETH